MKAILIIVFLFIIQNSYSQTDTDSKKRENKPSWGSKMPTREVTPNLKFETDLDDDEDEIDMNDLGIDRSRLLNSEEERNIDNPIQIETPIVTSPDKLKKIEEDKIKEQKRKAEESRVALEQQKKDQQRKFEEEKRIAENLKEQQRIEEEKRIAENLKEQQRIEEEKRIADIIKRENSLADKKEEASVGENQLETVVISAPKVQKYSWKKIKNALPLYPSKAAREKKEGWVEVELTIDSSGLVSDAKAVRFANNYRGFNNAAIRAVKKWKFEPPSNYGIDNKLSKIVRLVFQL